MRTFCLPESKHNSRIKMASSQYNCLCVARSSQNVLLPTSMQSKQSVIVGEVRNFTEIPTRNLSLKICTTHSPLLDESWDGMVDLGYRPTGHQGRHAVGDIGLGCQPD